MIAGWTEAMVYRISLKRESVCCTPGSPGFVLRKIATYPYIMTWVEDRGSYGFFYFLLSTLFLANIMIAMQAFF